MLDTLGVHRDLLITVVSTCEVCMYVCVCVCPYHVYLWEFFVCM